VGLERGPLSLVSTTEELLERNRSGSGLKNRAYDLKVTLTTRHPLSAKVGTNLADKGARSVVIVRSRTQATEFSVV
jgi:hypothetical protein